MCVLRDEGALFPTTFPSHSVGAITLQGLQETVSKDRPMIPELRDTPWTSDGTNSRPERSTI